MKTNTAMIIILGFLGLIFIIFGALLVTTFLNREAEETYNPKINSNDFVSVINNKYLTLTPGTKFIYSGKTEEGTERIEVYVTNEKKLVMGILTTVVWDREYLNGELIEDTKDWFAQDKYGNVWYFGEDSKEIIDEKIVSTKGSWEAGIDGAKPGVIMEANPQIGDTYKQEYYKGEAEDMGEVVAFGVKLNVKHGTFTNCLQTREWTPLEPGADEYKYYCPEVGNAVYEAGIEDRESVQLINVQKDSDVKITDEPVEELKKGITEAKAIIIAQNIVQGEVTDVEIEKKYGKTAYIVEIDADGTETDVIIDIETGEVLGIET
ncbi:PepSY domain-containing protein [Candidatus Woesearchaeota archaeon]|nr:PepSY domain-containing protein [Candidatus Woesearchaeota archaeon]